MSQVRALLHLVPAGPAAQLHAAVAALTADPDLVVLARAENCFVGPASPCGATIETLGDDADLAPIVERCRRALEVLGASVDQDASMAIVGADLAFGPTPEAPTPFRFQYLMRRRHDFTHEAYLHRYREIHSEFGLRTRNLEGYVQHHVDPALSEMLGNATGLSGVACDSMSELHSRSIEHFLEGVIAHPEVGREAQQDEERFVDRDASFGFCDQLLPG